MSILEILRAPILRKNGQLWIFGPKFAQKWILWSKLQKSKSGFGISTSKIICAPIFKQNGHFWNFGPKFGQKWGREFKNLSLDFKINTSKIPCMPFFIQNGHILIFCSKFGEIAQLRVIFWFKYYSVFCRELSGGWNELGGGGWKWVELGARFSNTHKLFYLHLLCKKLLQNQFRRISKGSKIFYQNKLGNPESLQ